MSYPTVNTGEELVFLEKQQDKRILQINAWTMQNIVYEVIASYMLANDPETLGFSFKQKYDSNPTKTTIFLDIAYNWKQANASKRPAIFIRRGEVQIATPTMGTNYDVPDIKESTAFRFTQNQMPINITVVGTNLGFTEQLAEYVKQPLVAFAQEIRQDFNLRKFKLAGISAPQNVVEQKDHFSIELLLQTAFDEGWAVHGDHLKLKTVSKQIFDQVTKRLLIEQ